MIKNYNLNFKIYEREKNKKFQEEL